MRLFNQDTKTYFIVCLVLLLGLLGLFAHRLQIKYALFEASLQADQAIFLADELRQTSDDLSRFVRSYIVTSDARFKAKFQEILDIRDGRQPSYQDMDNSFWWRFNPETSERQAPTTAMPLLDKLNDLPLQSTEKRLLTDAKYWSDQLALREQEAMALIESDPSPAALSLAIAIVYADEYSATKERIHNNIFNFRKSLTERLDKAQENLQEQAAVNEAASVSIGLLLLLALIALYRSVTLDRQREQKIQEDLAESRNELIAASKKKEEVLSIIGHELKTPLNSMLALCELIGKSSDLDDIKQDTAALGHVSLGLGRLINRIIGLAATKEIRASIKPKWLALKRLKKSLTLNYASMARQQHVAFEVTVSETASALEFYTDHALIEEILDELIDNAIKFAPGGRVSVTVDFNSGSDDKGSLEFTVADDGAGLAKGDEQNIFEMFSQIDTSDARQHQGLGLGLFIAKRLVDQLKGRISLESKSSSGCTFRFTLPVTARPIASTESAAHNWLKGSKILLVDDQPLTLEITSRLLEAHGAEVCTASGGQQAIDLLEHSPTDFHFVLLDLQMPEVDGYAVVNWIRLQPHLKGLTVYAFTAGLTDGTEQDLKAKGFNGLFLKPLKIDLLAEHENHRRAA